MSSTAERADVVFRHARSFNAWTDRPVAPSLLHELYELVRWGPTSANCAPLRIVFVESAAERARLAAMTHNANPAKVMEAPVTAILAYDSRFIEHLPRLFPHNPALAERWALDPDLLHVTAFRNSSMQAGYFIVAARLLGLDCGPLSGFDEAAVNEAYFPDGRDKVNLLCCLGHGDATRDFWKRLPRLAFDEACRLL